MLVLDVSEPLHVFLQDVHRRVHGIEREIQEERLVLVPVDVSHRLPREVVGEVFSGHRAVAITQHGAWLLEIRVIAAAAAEEAVEMIEAPRVGVELRRIADVPLADRDRGVAGCLQVIAQRLLLDSQAHELGIDTRRWFVGEIELVAVTLRVAPGQDAGPRRAAERRRHVGIGIGHAVGRDRVDIGRHHFSAILETEIGVARVVGQDHDDIRCSPVARPGTGLLASAAAGHRQEDKQQGSRVFSHSQPLLILRWRQYPANRRCGCRAYRG